MFRQATHHNTVSLNKNLKHNVKYFSDVALIFHYLKVVSQVFFVQVVLIVVT